MVITRTPLRISFVGGGTDINEYYRTGYGAVVSATINKYMYITVNRRFDRSIRLSYSKTEIVGSVEELQHDIVKACLQLVGIDHGLEITSISDVPAGTGLGSSSSFTVGLLNALYIYIGQQRSALELAQKACQIEIDTLGNPIGKQDQFAAAFGGLNYYRFNADEIVLWEKLPLTKIEINRLNECLLMFYTGINRDANPILLGQKKSTASKLEVLDFMRTQADSLKADWITGGMTDDLGVRLDAGWRKKQSLTDGISNREIDQMYARALSAGATGGKLLGAGGGGFLLIYCEPACQKAVRQAINAKELDFRFTNHGSRVIYFSEDL